MRFYEIFIHRSIPELAGMDAAERAACIEMATRESVLLRRLRWKHCLLQTIPIVPPSRLTRVVDLAFATTAAAWMLTLAVFFREECREIGEKADAWLAESLGGPMPNVSMAFAIVLTLAVHYTLFAALLAWLYRRTLRAAIRSHLEETRRCPGCRLDLVSTPVERAAGRDLVVCPECGKVSTVEEIASGRGGRVR